MINRVHTPTQVYVLDDRVPAGVRAWGLLVFCVLWMGGSGAAFASILIHGIRNDDDIGGLLISGVFLLFGIGLLFLAWRTLRSPYEVEITTTGLVRFVGLTSTTQVRVPDIVELVRRHQNGDMAGFDVVHRGGTVFVAADDDLLTRFRTLCPTARVRSKTLWLTGGGDA